MFGRLGEARKQPIFPGFGTAAAVADSTIALQLGRNCGEPGCLWIPEDVIKTAANISKTEDCH